MTWASVPAAATTPVASFGIVLCTQHHGQCYEPNGNHRR
jgi:hypothetical protein